jgi:hypothetical protein
MSSSLELKRNRVAAASSSASTSSVLSWPERNSSMRAVLMSNPKVS